MSNIYEINGKRVLVHEDVLFQEIPREGHELSGLYPQGAQHVGGGAKPAAKPATAKAGKKEKVCGRCKKPGHTAWHCPEKK